MATFNHISGAEPSTVTFKLATVTQTRNSSVMHQEILTLGDPDSSLALAAVLNAVPATTAWGLVVRQVDYSTSVTIAGNSTVAPLAGSVWTIQGNSTVAPLAGSTWNVRALQSSAADLQATVAQASTVWAVQLANYSTTAQVSSVGGVVAVSQNSTTWQVQINGNSTVLQGTNPWVVSGASTVAPLAGSTWNTRPIQSSAADLQVTATIGTNLQSTTAPSSASSGLIVRQVVDAILTTASTSAFASTSLTIQSSGAGLRSYVTAYSITTTNAGPSKVGFYSSGTITWPIQFAAISSAVTGVNLAVSAPAYIFRTAVAEALTLQLGGGASTVGGWRAGVSYFRAP